MYEELQSLVDPSFTSVDEWTSWFDRFMLAIARLNPSPAVRAVISEEPNRAGDLFTVSLAAVWTSPIPPYIRDVITCIFESALESVFCPTSIAESLILAVRFMDMQDGSPLPIRMPVVAVAAERHKLYAKALYFRELEFRESAAMPSSECVESLIAVNIKLDQFDSVQGLLRSSASEFVRVRPSWHEKLENWHAALTSYSVRSLEDPAEPEWFNGRMRCLSALGEWDRLLHATEKSDSAFKAAACFNLQKWDALRSTLDHIPSPTEDDVKMDLLVMEASWLIRAGRLDEARHVLQEARRLLLGAGVMSPIRLAKAQGKREYDRYIRDQQLEQLGEIIEFKSSAGGSVSELKAKWNDRLLHMDYSVAVWQRLVPIRAILFDPAEEDIDIWVRFSTLARKTQNLTMSERIVARLAAVRPGHYGVILARIKNIYATGDTDQASRELEEFLLVNKSALDQCSPYLRSKICLALSFWQPPDDAHRAVVERYAREAVRWDPASYKAWSGFALIKFRQAQRVGYGPHVQEAVDALFKSISLSGSVQLPDVLRLLSLWFSFYGAPSSESVNGTVAEAIDASFDAGFASIPSRVWLQALPQILARLRSRRVSLRAAVKSLLLRIGLEFPQSVVFALTVAASHQSTDPLSEGAKHVLEAIAKPFPTLVTDCDVWARELVRVSTSLTEQWSVALEEASRLYFIDKDVLGMLRVLSRVHTRLGGAPETPAERGFTQSYKHDLDEAYANVGMYSQTQNKFFLEQAWNVYYWVFQRLHKDLSRMKTLSLPRVSPKLDAMSNSSVRMPGCADESVTIAHMRPSVDVLVSKQKPRVVHLTGSDGKLYKFLLKGNEDLKQDERVMQLFGLINSVIAESVASRRRSGVFPSTPGIERLDNVQLRRFAVVPLSASAGLIEWVNGCDTLHAVIKNQREARSIPLSLEHTLLRQYTLKFDELVLLDKVEVFCRLLTQTAGDEVRTALWHGGHTGTAEDWLKRRSMYSRSLAVTSAVGYILGLGDRHPSNIMIDTADTGQVVHIDFGDCFDVAAVRERYPEKIPFRLTRQLVNALDVAGVEGTFRITMERMMDLIRKNSDTIMAMLEAFIYDPLITWRLVMQPPNALGSVPAGPSLSSGGRSSTVESESTTLSVHAKTVVARVHSKLLGADEAGNIQSVSAQVESLIQQATAPENLCQCYVGWCPFW